MDNPKVFISYSWTDQEHTEWVVALAERLMGDTVDVVLDRWDLREGHDKYVFMEKMVTDASVTKVLMICDKAYQEKANGRAGGVGTESQIISAEVYGKVAQEKFIPVVVEYDNDVPCLPAFLKSTIYIDLSGPETDYVNYEKLVRAIFNKPLYKKPQLGTKPSFLLEDSTLKVKTSYKFREFKDAIVQQRPHAKGAERQYLKLMIEALSECRVSDSSDAFDDAIIQSISDLKIYRDELIDFFDLKCTYGGESPEFTQVFDFFEELAFLFGPPPGVTSYNQTWADNFKFFAWELFLYLIAILMKNDLARVAAFFLEDLYHVRGSDRTQAVKQPYTLFAQYCRGIEEYRNSRLKLQKVSLTAFILHERADSTNVSFSELAEADFILCLRHIVHAQDHWPNWFPRLLVYTSRWGTEPFRAFAKATSKKHQVALCSLLGVTSIKELITLFTTAEQRGMLDGYHFNSSFGKIPFRGLMNFDELATLT
jgi:hypothetical protein